MPFSAIMLVYLRSLEKKKKREAHRPAREVEFLYDDTLEWYFIYITRLVERSRSVEHCLVYIVSSEIWTAEFSFPTQYCNASYRESWLVV